MHVRVLVSDVLLYSTYTLHEIVFVVKMKIKSPKPNGFLLLLRGVVR